MTWLQTLVIAAVPAIVAAASLLGQNELAALRERRKRREDREGAQRAEAKAAHLSQTSGLTDLWSSLRDPVDRTFDSASDGSELLTNRAGV